MVQIAIVAMFPVICYPGQRKSLVFVGLRERERERERQRDRESQRQADRQTETDRQREEGGRERWERE